MTRELRQLSRPAGEFDVRRYFRDAGDLGFYNCGTTAMRALAKRIYFENRERWSIGDAMQLADHLMKDRYLETKAVGIELVARYRRSFTPAMLGRWKRWLASGWSANWATTDTMCGALIGPLLVQYPALAKEMPAWSTHRSLWVRRASIVGLIPLARKGEALPLLYRIARRLHADDHDLIQKAVGWALREAGKTDMPRLEQYLRANGPSIPRTTLRYAIERFPKGERATLLKDTRGGD